MANNLVPDFVPVSSKGYVTFSTHNYEIGTSATVTVGDLDLAGRSVLPGNADLQRGRQRDPFAFGRLGGGIFIGSIPTVERRRGRPATAFWRRSPAERSPSPTMTPTTARDPATVTDQATTFSVDHFTFTTISGPETAGVPFSVTVKRL